MPNAANPLVPADGAITITDGTSGTPLSFVIDYEDGDFKAGELSKTQKTKQSFKNRGKTYSVRDIEDEEIDFEFSCHAVHIVGDGTTATPGDVVLALQAWSAAQSILPAANGDAYLVQVSWTGERTDFDASADAALTLKYCELKMSFAEGVPGRLTIKGKAYPISNDYITVQ